MIINNAPQHEAVMSNVGEIGEFRIRNSSKAFHILSSGLYANKIRAIIRELSCNAVDSHTAADRASVPFDVHLPNQLDPTFRIRDYGTGLSHEQVINIYTTYFESTKTESNQFIGALGLGSKSPFSYTDNFTVTAIRDGVRGVYSAFINGEGVPSIALMHSEPTDQPAGVEVQFAVTDRYDFDKFRSEAREVFTYFRLRPVVSGGEGEFQFRDVEYTDRNIIPGVHSLANSRHTSRAVMGNIAYPIDVPNADTNLGPLAKLLNCGLEMHFEIGELDFQASREGLSYIPSTIEAIKAKLIALNAQLAVHLALEADAIENQWEKVYFLMERSHMQLWAEAVRAYITSTKVELMDASSNHYVHARKLSVKVEDIANRYNIDILAFDKSRGNVTCHEMRPSKVSRDKPNQIEYDLVWNFNIERGEIFVINDTKKGALARAKYHWRHAAGKGVELPKNNGHHHNVYVLSPATKGRAMDVKGFFDELKDPPSAQVLSASSLLEKERKEANQRGKDVRIMRMTHRDYGRGNTTVAWTEAGSAADYDAAKTHYYIALSGYTAQDVKMDVKELHRCLGASGVGDLKTINILGVRKGDIEWVRAQKNWVLLEDRVGQVLNNISVTALATLANNQVDPGKLFGYNKEIATLVPATSPYRVLVDKFRGVERVSFNLHCFNQLRTVYAPNVNIDSVIAGLETELAAVRERYPLLTCIRDWDIKTAAVAEYINIIDLQKGI